MKHKVVDEYVRELDALYSSPSFVEYDYEIDKSALHSVREQDRFDMILDYKYWLEGHSMFYFMKWVDVNRLIGIVKNFSIRKEYKIPELYVLTDVEYDMYDVLIGMIMDYNPYSDYEIQQMHMCLIGLRN